MDALPHRALAADASGFLSAAGRRVLRAGDRAAAANLLRRAVALRPAEDPGRAALLIDLGGVLGEEGRFDDAADALAQAMRVAKACDDSALVARAQVERMLANLQVDPEGVARQASRLGGRLSRTLTEADDHAGLARLWHLRGLLSWIRGRAGDASDCWRWAAEQASLTADDRTLADALGWEASAATHGPTPVDDAFARCTEILGRLTTNPWAAALVQHQVACLHAMRGEFDRAFVLLDEANKRWPGSRRPSTRRSRTRRCSSRCWRASRPGPNGTSGPGADSWRRWVRRRCSPRQRRYSAWQYSPRAGPTRPTAVPAAPRASRPMTTCRHR